MDIVPKAPKPEKIEITDLSKQRLEEWIEYFENLSDLIEVFDPKNELFDVIFDRSRAMATNLLTDPSVDQIIDWPTKKEVAFILTIDKPHSSSTSPEHVKIFCFGDLSFSVNHYYNGWDGDSENLGCHTYSLNSYPRSALTWEYSTKLIKNDLEDIKNEIKQRVPSSPNES